MTATVMAWSLSRLAAGQRVVLASVVETAGSVPGKVGARLAMDSDEQWVGTVGGAGLEIKDTVEGIKEVSKLKLAKKGICGNS